jgi:hypothetical protein
MTLTKYRVSLKRVAALLVVIFGGMLFAAHAQKQPQGMPVVVRASLALYPRTALLAHIEGIVKIQVTTDGKTIASLEPRSGPAMLVQAAEENLRTWQFDEHKPTTFATTFEYRLEDPAVCSVENATVITNVPAYVKVITKRVHTCDPTTVISSARPK